MENVYSVKQINKYSYTMRFQARWRSEVDGLAG